MYDYTTPAVFAKLDASSEMARKLDATMTDAGTMAWSLYTEASADLHDAKQATDADDRGAYLHSAFVLATSARRLYELLGDQGGLSLCEDIRKQCRALSVEEK